MISTTNSLQNRIADQEVYVREVFSKVNRDSIVTEDQTRHVVEILHAGELMENRVYLDQIAEEYEHANDIQDIKYLAEKVRLLEIFMNLREKLHKNERTTYRLDTTPVLSSIRELASIQSVNFQIVDASQ